MSDSFKAINAVIAVVGGLFAIGVGVIWSQEFLSKGTFGFDLGYLTVAIAVSRVLSTRLAGVPRKQLRWLSLLFPTLLMLTFEALAAWSLNRLHEQLSVNWLLLFASSSAFMLWSALILLVSFNYEDGFGPFSSNERRIWRKWSLLAAVMLSILVVWEPVKLSLRIRASFDFSSVTIYSVLVELESWYYRCSLIIYFFMIVRMLFPTLQNRILGSGPGDSLTKSTLIG